MGCLLFLKQWKLHAPWTIEGENGQETAVSSVLLCVLQSTEQHKLRNDVLKFPILQEWNGWNISLLYMDVSSSFSPSTSNVYVCAHSNYIAKLSIYVHGFQWCDIEVSLCFDGWLCWFMFTAWTYSYSIIMSCWELKPEDRPNFSDISVLIEDYWDREHAYVVHSFISNQFVQWHHLLYRAIIMKWAKNNKEVWSALA